MAGAILWRDGRVVEGARLESVLGATLRRFESCSLRIETEQGWHTLNGIGGCFIIKANGFAFIIKQRRSNFCQQAKMRGGG
ncbi:MAG: hypothetical protein US70_C0011G0026 [Parcubacteria group bacterium GW2011_GWD2_38_11]|nr:MAG: hypothetical protein US70_C0011G0026 [Parcubacteria group bacterium GW2011_GWD2_38_11]